VDIFSFCSPIIISCFRDHPPAVASSFGASGVEKISLLRSKPCPRSLSLRNAPCVQSIGDICPRKCSWAGCLTCSSRNLSVRQTGACTDGAKIQRSAELRLLLTLPCVRVQDSAERAYALQRGHNQMPALRPGLRGKARQKAAEHFLSDLGRRQWRTGKANRLAITHGTPGFTSGWQLSLF
jgi:hypothetical protein